MNALASIRRAIADFEAIYGEGAAKGEIAIGVFAFAAFLGNVAGWLAISGAAS